jgi:hypothetical protein
MATLAELQTSIDNLLKHPKGAGSFSLVRIVEEKAYEAYVFGLCLQAVRTLGITPTLLGITGSPTPFIFRGGPGQIHSTRRNYGYAYFDLAGIAFEIHCGVEYRGTSAMTHELDVSILRAEDATACRNNPDDPGSASVFGAWECKFYDSRLDKNLARSFVGLVDDLGSNIRLAGFCSNNWHKQMPDFFEPKRRPYPHLVLTPLSPNSEARFVQLLAAELKKMARL